MAKTLIGQLVLMLKDSASGPAKTASRNISNSIRDIERSAGRLNNAKWGAGFQRQLEKLGISGKTFQQVGDSWDRLHRRLNSKNLSTALRKSEISAWKTATIGHFTDIRAQMAKTEARARTHSRLMQTALRPAMVMLGGYTGAYVAGVAGRGGLTAASAFQREGFRQDMANIPQVQKDKIYGKSKSLSDKYTSVSITDIMELARTARNTMGNTDRGMEILPGLVKGMVTLQSTKGVDVAVNEMMNLIRGIDNLGKNGSGALGVKNTLDIIDGVIRAAQIEGADLDVGKLFGFARRSKIAGPGLSTDFLMTTAPAFMQDMTAEGFGTALSSAYKAFVIGAKDTASKKNINAQKELGIRTGEGHGELVDSELFGTNPYQWVKKNLVPALEKSGVDMTSETEIAKAVSQLSRNSNATGLLTRMITQQEQVDRLIGLYADAAGTDAADSARVKDPFVAYEGLITSLKNLSAAVGTHVMPTIVPALNSMADMINNFATSVMEGDGLAVGASAAGGAAALYGGYKGVRGIISLMTAGTHLQTAAAMLQKAALAQGGDGLLDGSGRKGGKGAAAGLLGFLGKIGGVSLATIPLFSGSDSLDENGNPQSAEDARRAMRRVKSPSDFQHMNAPKTNQFASGAYMEELQAITAGAGNAGEQIRQSLSVDAKPNVDNSSIKESISLAQQLLNLLGQVGSAATSTRSSLQQEIEGGYSDYGVTP